MTGLFECIRGKNKLVCHLKPVCASQSPVTGIFKIMFRLGRKIQCVFPWSQNMITVTTPLLHLNILLENHRDLKYQCYSNHDTWALLLYFQSQTNLTERIKRTPDHLPSELMPFPSETALMFWLSTQV